MERFLTDPSRLLIANNPREFEVILQKLSRPSDIEVLILQYCGIDDNGAIRLARKLSNCRCLVYFDVQYNLITAEGSEVLCRVLMELMLQLLYVQGLFEIEGAFKGNRFSILSVSILFTPGSAITMTLQEICLSEMNLGDEGMEMVAKRLEYLPELVKLFFYDNAVGEAGASSLARFLPRARKLRYINLIKNHIPSRFEDIFEAINRNRTDTGQHKVNVDMTQQLRVFEGFFHPLVLEVLFLQ